MKLLNHIHDVIRNYPTLYKTKTYKESELLVLDHLFLTNGNGYEWFDGYLTGYYINPKPYDTETAPLLSAGFFDTEETKLQPVDPVMVEFFKEHGVCRNFIEKDGTYYREELQSARRMGGDFQSFNPYPICQYAKMENMPDDVRPDWLAGAIKIVKATLAYFQDDEAIKSSSYYPTENYITGKKRDYNKWWNEGDSQLIKSFGLTEEVMADIDKHCWNSWNKFKARQFKYVNDFLKKN